MLSYWFCLMSHLAWPPLIWLCRLAGEDPWKRVHCSRDSVGAIEDFRGQWKNLIPWNAMRLSLRRHTSSEILIASSVERKESLKTLIAKTFLSYFPLPVSELDKKFYLTVKSRGGRSLLSIAATFNLQHIHGMPNT